MPMPPWDLGAKTTAGGKCLLYPLVAKQALTARPWILSNCLGVM
jgi:hypothetical protein